MCAKKLKDTNFTRDRICGRGTTAKIELTLIMHKNIQNIRLAMVHVHNSVGSFCSSVFLCLNEFLKDIIRT